MHMFSALKKQPTELTVDELKTQIQQKYKTTFQDPFSEEVWRNTYKHHSDETIDDTLFRVAAAIASVEPTEKLKIEWTEKFYDLLSEFKATAGGRIYANAGTDWNGTTLINCFVGPRLKENVDSIDGILSHLRTQVHTLKSEGGWGENFSYIRPRGSFIHGIGVETPGAVKFMEMFDKASEIITAGSGKKSTNKTAKGKIRKGAMMAVLDVWHPDIVEFITAKQHPGRLTKFNISVNCTDEFMQRVNKLKILKEMDATAETIEQQDKWDLRFPDTSFEKYKTEWTGDLRAWELKGYPVNVHQTISVSWLWNLIMESTYNRAEPGVLFLDRANYFNPLNYAETIFATNPCFTGDTLIATEYGLLKIEDLVTEQRLINVISSNEPIGESGIALRPISSAIMTGIRKVVKLNLSNGMSIRCTPEHQFWTTENQYTKAMDLLDKELTLTSSGVTTIDRVPIAQPDNIVKRMGLGWNKDFAFLLGWASGDGWISKNTLGLIFGKNDNDALNRIQSIYNKWGFNPKPSIDKNGSTTLYVCNKELIEYCNQYGLVQCTAGQKRVPSFVFQSPKYFIVEYLNGLFSADGSIISNVNSNFWIALCSKSKELLNDVQLLLLMLGMTHHATYDINKESTFTYTTKTGEHKTYIGGAYHDLRIFGKDILKFYENVELTVKRKQVALNVLQNKRFKNKAPTVKVISIVEDGTEAVYDLTVPVTHNFIANGLVVHNCGEQTLAPGGICCLGSLNLTQFINEDQTGFDLEKVKKYAKYLVRFLDNVNSYSPVPLPEYEYSIRNKRRIGVGILGWGSALYMLKTRFASSESDALRDQLMKTIAQSAYEASIDLAEEKGKFSLCDPDKHWRNPFVSTLGLSQEYVEKLKKVGIRNSSLLSIQPTGNTSILANVVSGGLEPVFMHEYIRTVIVSDVPSEIADVTPKWFEGEWKETKMFKFTKEGDEQILKGKAPCGTVYKIDKNRGLTKEVLCEDYGVRFMRKNHKWDGRMGWTVTAMSLSVNDHVNDLKGFARWVDSAMSKTVNVPHDYKFEDFQNIYLDAYSSEYVKGVTTYRSGTMTTVLAAKDEKNISNKHEEIILEDVKLPDSAPATMKTLKAEGHKYYLTVLWWDEQKVRPFGFFVHTNSHEKSATTNDAVEILTKLARQKGIPKKHIDKVLEKIDSDNNVTKLARMISFNLRHGVLIRSIVASLEKVKDVYVGSFLFAITKFLSTLIKDGEPVLDETCLECKNGQIVYQQGCKMCISCGSSKCG